MNVTIEASEPSLADIESMNFSVSAKGTKSVHAHVDSAKGNMQQYDKESVKTNGAFHLLPLVLVQIVRVQKGFPIINILVQDALQIVKGVQVLMGNPVN